MNSEDEDDPRNEDYQDENKDISDRGYEKANVGNDLRRSNPGYELSLVI